MDKEQACKNTDTEIIFRGDDFSGRVIINRSGGIGIAVGGHVIVRTAQAWHEAALAPEPASCEDCPNRFSQIGKAPAPVADDCGNCLYKMGCKFSRIATEGIKVTPCQHYKCCYELAPADDVVEMAEDLRTYVKKHGDLKTYGSTCTCYLCDSTRLVEKWSKRLTAQKEV